MFEIKSETNIQNVTEAPVMEELSNEELEAVSGGTLSTRPALGITTSAATPWSIG